MPKRGLELSKTQINAYCKKHGFPLPDGLSPSPDTQLPSRDGALAKAKGKGSNSGKCAVSIVSYRARATDPDALVGKYFLDALRYAGLLFDDRPEDITYEISQKACAKKEEKTLVTVRYPNGKIV